MKGIFLIFEPLFDHSGISKKIISQLKGFEENGVSMELSNVTQDSKGRYNGRAIDNKNFEKYFPLFGFSKLEWRMRFSNLANYILEKKFDIVYIRYTHFANPFFIKFLNKIKKGNIKILLEVPTFPYDQEYGNPTFKQDVLLKIEEQSRKKFSNYIDKIITFSDFDNIFGVPTIRISNGIDPETCQLAFNKKDKIKINFIGVASLNFWHGFDRLITGIHQYLRAHTSPKQIIFHIVGDKETSEAVKYQKLTQQLNLEENIIFHGKKTGKDLDTIFRIADLGIGCLGCHRKGIEYIKSIKNREYCARGIPFIYSEIDSDFEDKSFIIKASADEKPIDIKRVLEFLESNKFNPRNIRKFATENLTWQIQISKVLKSI